VPSPSIDPTPTPSVDPTPTATVEPSPSVDPTPTPTETPTPTPTPSHLVISGENSQSVESYSARIIWNTDIASTSRVVYDTISHFILGEDVNYGYANSTVRQDVEPMVISHLVTLSELNAGTTYYYRAISSASPEKVSEELTLVTLSVTSTPIPTATPIVTPTPTPTPAPVYSGGGSYFIFVPPVANGSVVVNNNSEKTNSTSVRLSLAASEQYQMAISNTADFYGIGWENFASERSWNLTSDDGPKTVYAKFRNIQGGISSVYSDLIILDTFIPVPTLIPTPASTPIFAFAPGTNLGNNDTTSSSSFTPKPNEQAEISSPTPTPQPSVEPSAGSEPSDNKNNENNIGNGHEQEQKPEDSTLTASIANFATLGTGNLWVSFLILLIIGGIIYYFTREEKNKERE
jgi:hypothetical protein